MINSEGNEVFISMGEKMGLLYAFTKEQREAIRARDGGNCQVKKVIPHECNDNKGVQIHHILPQRFSKDMGIINPDYPENGISLCENFHQHYIHPDMGIAQKKYGQDRESFKEAFARRNEMLENKQIYWNTNYDRIMGVIAVRNTQKSKKEGWIFPEKE